MDVSIIIVNWNTRDILRNCLLSIYEQTKEIDFEVIVVDNASTDGSVEMVKRDFPHSALIENMGNRGFAAANNQGMKIANGRYILLLNSDTVVLDKAIQKTVAFADLNSGAAVVGCKVLNPNLSLQPTCFMFPSILNMFIAVTYLYKLFPRNRFFGRERMTWWNREDVREVDVVTGCFMLVRKEAIEQTGVMDEGYFMYAEETDWCWRFKQAGWENLFYPDARIIHLGGQSSKKVRIKSIVNLRLGILRFILKNKGYFVFLFAGILLSFFFLIRIPIWLLMSFINPDDLDCRNRSKAYISGWCKVIRVIFVPRTENFKA